MPVFNPKMKYEKWEVPVVLVDVEPSPDVRNARRHMESIEDKMLKLRKERKEAWADKRKYEDIIERGFPNRCRNCGGTSKYRGVEGACCVPDGWDPLYRNSWDFSKDERKEEAYLRGPFKKHPAFDLEEEALAKFHDLSSQLASLNHEHELWHDKQIYHEKEQLKSLGYDIHGPTSPRHPVHYIKGHITEFSGSFWHY